MKRKKSFKSKKAQCFFLYNGQTENLKLTLLPCYLKYFRIVSYQGVKKARKLTTGL